MLTFPEATRLIFTLANQTDNISQAEQNRELLRFLASDEAATILLYNFCRTNHKNAVNLILQLVKKHSPQSLNLLVNRRSRDSITSQILDSSLAHVLKNIQIMDDEIIVALLGAGANLHGIDSNNANAVDFLLEAAKVSPDKFDRIYFFMQNMLARGGRFWMGRNSSPEQQANLQAFLLKLLRKNDEASDKMIMDLLQPVENVAVKAFIQRPVDAKSQRTLLHILVNRCLKQSPQQRNYSLLHLLVNCNPNLLTQRDNYSKTPGDYFASSGVEDAELNTVLAVRRPRPPRLVIDQQRAAEAEAASTMMTLSQQLTRPNAKRSLFGEGVVSTLSALSETPVPVLATPRRPGLIPLNMPSSAANTPTKSRKHSRDESSQASTPAKRSATAAEFNFVSPPARTSRAGSVAATPVVTPTTATTVATPASAAPQLSLLQRGYSVVSTPTSPVLACRQSLEKFVTGCQKHKTFAPTTITQQENNIQELFKNLLSTLYGNNDSIALVRAVFCKEDVRAHSLARLFSQDEVRQEVFGRLLGAAVRQKNSQRLERLLTDISLMISGLRYLLERVEDNTRKLELAARLVMLSGWQCTTVRNVAHFTVPEKFTGLHELILQQWRQKEEKTIQEMIGKIKNEELLASVNEDVATVVNCWIRNEIDGLLAASTGCFALNHTGKRIENALIPRKTITENALTFWNSLVDELHNWADGQVHFDKERFFCHMLKTRGGMTQNEIERAQCYIGIALLAADKKISQKRAFDLKTMILRCDAGLVAALSADRLTVNSLLERYGRIDEEKNETAGQRFKELKRIMQKLNPALHSDILAFTDLKKYTEEIFFNVLLEKVKQLTEDDMLKAKCLYVVYILDSNGQVTSDQAEALKVVIPNASLPELEEYLSENKIRLTRTINDEQVVSELSYDELIRYYNEEIRDTDEVTKFKRDRVVNLLQTVICPELGQVIENAKEDVNYAVELELIKENMCNLTADNFYAALANIHLAVHGLKFLIYHSSQYIINTGDAEAWNVKALEEYAGAGLNASLRELKLITEAFAEFQKRQAAATASAADGSSLSMATGDEEEIDIMDCTR